MRKGEKAKLKIKKNYGFSSTLDPELLRIPDSCKDEEMLKKLKTKGIIYEITLHDWEIGDDLDHDNNVVKIVSKRAKGSFDKPNGIDEVTVNISVYQEKGKLLSEEMIGYTAMLDDIGFTPSIKKILETMRSGEIARGEIQPKFYLENDKEAIEMFNLDISKPFYFDIELVNFVGIVDWYLDKTAFKKELRKGFSGSPFIESTV